MDDGWQEMNDGGQGMDDDGFKDCIEVADEEIIPDHIKRVLELRNNMDIDCPLIKGIVENAWGKIIIYTFIVNQYLYN